MNIHVETDNLHDIEYYIILNLIGVLSALYEGAVSIDDAEHIIFSPGFAENAEKCGINSDIVKIIWQGTELEDVESLCPEKLPENILELRNNALALCLKIIKPIVLVEKMSITVNNTGTTHTLLKGFPDEIKFEENED